LIIDSVLRGYALHTVYGWSLHMLGAVWGSITSLLLHLGRGKDARPTQNSDNGIELQSVRTETPEPSSGNSGATQPTLDSRGCQTENTPGKRVQFHMDDEITQKFRSLRRPRE